MFTLKYKRKILIYVLTVILMMLAARYMEAAKYEPFLKYMVLLAVAFFTSNGLEHVAKSIQGKRDNAVTQYPPGEGPA